MTISAAAPRRVLIVGAGALGISLAYHLQQLGLPHVQLVERQFPGSGSTGWSAGLVSVQLWNPDDVRLVLRSWELFTLAATRAHLSVERPGMYTLASEADAATLQTNVTAQQSVGAPVELVPRAAWAERLPTLQLDDVGAISYAAGDGMVAPGDYALALAGISRKRGAQILQNTPVRSLLVRDDVVRGITLGDGRTLEAEVVVLAAGVWSARLCESAGLGLPVCPYRTQIAILKMAQARAQPIVHDAAAGMYFRPEADEELLVGDGTTHHREDPDHYDESANVQFVESVAERLLHRMPAAASAMPAAGWAGLVLGTPDRLPLIGPHPTVEGLWLCLGGNGFGLMRAPALGELAAHRLLQRPLPSALRGLEGYGLPQRLADRWSALSVAQSGFTLR